MDKGADRDEIMKNLRRIEPKEVPTATNMKHRKRKRTNDKTRGYSQVARGKIPHVALEGGVLSARMSSVICKCSADSGAEKEGF